MNFECAINSFTGVFMKSDIESPFDKKRTLPRVRVPVPIGLIGIVATLLVCNVVRNFLQASAG